MRRWLRPLFIPALAVLSAFIVGSLFLMVSDLKHLAMVPTNPVGALLGAMGDVIGGQIALSFENIVVASPFVKSGRIKALAVTSAKRASALPNVPTMQESGVPGFEAIGWFGVVVPAATPKEIVAKLNAEMTRILNDAEVKERLDKLSFTPKPGSRAEFAAFMQSEIAKWGGVAKRAGIQPE